MADNKWVSLWCISPRNKWSYFTLPKTSCFGAHFVEKPEVHASGSDFTVSALGTCDLLGSTHLKNMRQSSKGNHLPQGK